MTWKRRCATPISMRNLGTRLSSVVCTPWLRQLPGNDERGRIFPRNLVEGVMRWFLPSTNGLLGGGRRIVSDGRNDGAEYKLPLVARVKFSDGTNFFRKQLIAISAGLVALVICSFLPSTIYRRLNSCSSARLC